MDAISQPAVHGTFQPRKDEYAIWPDGQADNVHDLLPTRPHNNGVGRNVPPVDTLRQSPRRIEFGGPSCFPLPANEEFDGDFQSNGIKEESPVHGQSLIYQERGGEGGPFRVLDSCPFSNLVNDETSAIRIERGCGNLEDDAIENISGLGPCPNAGRIRNLSPSLGKLRRIGTVGGTPESGRRSCRHILPNYWWRKDGTEGLMPQVSEGGRLVEPEEHCNNSPMHIDVIADESDRQRVADFVHMKIYKGSDFTDCLKEGSVLNDFVKDIQEYGFDHIIIISERDDGILFLDCYGRVFDWDMSVDALFPCGDSLEEASRTYSGKEAWIVEDDGTLFQIEYFTDAQLKRQCIMTNEARKFLEPKKCQQVGKIKEKRTKNTFE